MKAVDFNVAVKQTFIDALLDLLLAQVLCDAEPWFPVVHGHAVLAKKVDAESPWVTLSILGVKGTYPIFVHCHECASRQLDSVATKSQKQSRRNLGTVEFAPQVGSQYIKKPIKHFVRANDEGGVVVERDR